MIKYKIFCEGITDQVFIADCLEIFYTYTSIREKIKGTSKNSDKLKIIINDNIEVIEVGGCEKLSVDIYSSMLEDNVANGGVNIIVFDADYAGKINGNKGHELCVKKLEDIKRNKSLVFEYYLWPNDKGDGIIEDLLRKLIPTDNECIYGCIEAHHLCLESLPITDLRVAELKEKVGYYLYTVNKASRPSCRDYKDSKFWNLDVGSVDDLANFKSFLDAFFN